MVFESYEINFFRFVIRISISLMIFMLKYAFTHIFFTAYTSLGCRKCLIEMLFDRKPNKLLSRTPYRTRVAAHVILKYAKKMPCAPLSNYREIASKLTGISSRIKAESEKVFLAPRKPRNDVMKPCDFDKCEICINCKTIHKQDNKLYIIKNT